MLAMLSLLVACLAPSAAPGDSDAALALPSVPGFKVEVYATVTDPLRLAIDSSGVLFAGRDNSGSGGGPGDAVRIHRIGVGGSPVTEYGSSSTNDPDAVVVDEAGGVGSAGSVIVGGQISNGAGGQLSQILTNQFVATLVGPTTVFHNPTDLLIDGSRLLFTNASSPGLSPTGLYQFTGGTASALFTTPGQLFSVAQDPTGRIFVTMSGGTLRTYSSAGALLNASFATGLGPSGVMTIGALGGGAQEVYAVDINGNLLRIDLAGTTSVIGTGFGMTTDLEFGLAGELYVSEHSNDRVLCISPGPVSYCTAGTSASGCQATLSTTGIPSASAPTGFDVQASAAEGNKTGILFFATNGRQANSWGNGTSLQCVVPPVKRGGLLTGSGANGMCDGTFTQDLNAHWTARPSHNPGAGAVVQAQLWYRDPFNTSNQTTSLSDALEFLVGP